MASLMICGTRGSALALAQTQLAIDALSRFHPKVSIKKRVVRTSGDTLGIGFGGRLGDVGVFIRELDDLLVKREIDIAVHSLKDLPIAPRVGLEISAILPRRDPRDFLVSEYPLRKLSPGSSVGTSSPRRKAAVLRVRPDLEVVPLRGNLPTRLRKVAHGHVTAAVVAKAGLDRLGVSPPGFPLPLKDFVPSPGQGAIAVVARKGSKEAQLLRPLDHGPTRIAVNLERHVLHSLGGGCTAPVGIHAYVLGKKVALRAMVLSLDGLKVVRQESSFSSSSLKRGTRHFVEILERLGGKELVQEAARKTEAR